MRRAGGQSEAHCHRADAFERPCRNDMADALGGGQGFHVISSRQQQRKLFSAEARSRVVIARELRERAGDVAYHHIASRMPVRVVDKFQMIYIDEQQRARHAVTSPPFNLLPERSAEASAVQETRQVITISLGAQALHRLPESNQLGCAREEQFSVRGHLNIIERSGLKRRAQPRRTRFRRPHQDQRYTILRLGQHARQLIDADPFQARIRDDDVRACAPQCHERGQPPGHADDGEPCTLQ